MRADRAGSHLHPGLRLTWAFADGSATVYVVKAVGQDGVVTFDRLRYDTLASDQPSSREERVFKPIPVATFTTLNYTALGSTFQARADRMKVGPVVFDCAVTRVWRRQRTVGDGVPPAAPIYEEWVPVDGDHVVFPGCALQGEDPLGTLRLKLTAVQ